MFIQKGGNFIISKGNSKAVDSDKNVIVSDEMSYDKNTSIISALGNVVITTSSGTIRSDNAVFNSTTNILIMRKDEKRPEADVIYEGRKGFYSADKITFYNYENKRIVLEGDVRGKIQMEDLPE
ncbi:MAG: hypothetical protein LBQ37_00180 [Elusimicrobiota bacterium]|jgi:lipopolysaccharide assembly outer membrane protein LptD (OstA)|nr:hypothetical protein [Elusimicrobiota bacterium]